MEDVRPEFLHAHQHHVRRMLMLLLAVALLGAVTYFVGSALLEKSHSLTLADQNQDYTLQDYETPEGESCNIAVVPLSGELFVTPGDASYNSGASANTIAAQIGQAEQDDQIKGIMLLVNSPGGSPVGGEVIAKAMKAAKKPTLALIQDLGDSAAYLASTGAKYIVASAMSDVGDIGVTGSYVDYSGENAKNGAQFVQISAGKYKDAGNPERPLSAEEKALLQKSVDEEYATLVDEISSNRQIATSTVTNLANGASEPGSVAIHDHLIDEIGGTTEATMWLGKAAKVKAVLCKY